MLPDMNYPSSFRDYMLKDKANRNILIISALLIFIQFSIFKYFYPYAGFIDGDSYVYLDTAFWNKGINTYMIGYSMFLRLFSVFSTSDLSLVTFQYLFIEASALLLFFTIQYFFNPAKIIKYILLVFVVINPLFLYMANYVSSDAFFLALSLIWFSSLIWILSSPSPRLIIYHALILFLCFTVRYNALMYPIISLLVLGLSTTRIRAKWLGICLIVTLIGSFVVYNGMKYKALTGHWQYTPFSGWQLANNAMYAYKYVDSAHRKPVRQEFAALDTMIRKYFDTATNPFRHPEVLFKASTVYMWDYNTPLYKYRNSLFVNDSAASEFKRWSSMGPFYAKYGLYMIAKYPTYYLRYFIWPNTCKYYAPPIEFLAQYNSGEDSVHALAVQWFKYKTPKRLVRTKNLSVKVLNYYPILTGISNVVFCLCLFCLISLKFFQMRIFNRKVVLLVTVFWLSNAFFTIFSSSAALRFQSFPIILTTMFSFILIDLMLKTALIQDREKRSASILHERSTDFAFAHES